MTGRTNAGGGVQLPALTNPAAAGNIQSGYQAINGEGEVVTGTYVPDTSEYGLLEELDISFNSYPDFTATIKLPNPIKSLLGLNFALKGGNGEGDIDAVFTFPGGIYTTPSESAMWWFIGGRFGWMSVSTSGNTITAEAVTPPPNLSAYKFYCGSYRYIPS